MPLLKSSATVYGGAGGRGAKASLSTPEGLRNMLRNDRDREALCIEHTEFYTESRYSYSATYALEDEKQTMSGLNERLGIYVHRVRKLLEENQEAQRRIDAIVAKRKAPKGQDWDKIWKPLEALEIKIKNHTVENAGLLIQIEMASKASEDFRKQYDDEVKAKKVLEKELEKLKKDIIDIETKTEQVHSEITLVMETIKELTQEHKKRVDDLLERIKESEVKVEVDSSSSNLADIINHIRAQYAKIAEKILKETEDVYKDKFEKIKARIDINTKAWESAKAERKGLLKESNTLEIQINSGYNEFKIQEESVSKNEMEYSQKITSLHLMIVSLEAELKELKEKVELQGDKNEMLTGITLKLEREIQTYRNLLKDISDVTESALFDSYDALQKAQHSLHNEPKGDNKAKIPDVVDND